MESGKWKEDTVMVAEFFERAKIYFCKRIGGQRVDCSKKPDRTKCESLELLCSGWRRNQVNNRKKKFW